MEKSEGVINLLILFHWKKLSKETVLHEQVS